VLPVLPVGTPFVWETAAAAAQVRRALLIPCVAPIWPVSSSPTSATATASGPAQVAADPASDAPAGAPHPHPAAQASQASAAQLLAGFFAYYGTAATGPPGADAPHDADAAAAVAFDFFAQCASVRTIPQPTKVCARAAVLRERQDDFTMGPGLLDSPTSLSRPPPPPPPPGSPPPSPLAALAAAAAAAYTGVQSSVADAAQVTTVHRY